MTTASDAPRSRTHSWTDPVSFVTHFRGRSGLESLRLILDGAMPQAPISTCLDFALVEAEVGRVVFELRPAEYHYNPIGTVHGGVIATLCDSAASATVHSTLQANEVYTTLEIKVNFVRAVRAETGPLRCIGTLVSRGGRVATAEARLVDAADKLYAHASCTCLITAEPKSAA